jgi:hypothetical protein
MPGARALKVIADDGLYFRRIDRYPEDKTEGNREFFGCREQQILAGLNAKFSESIKVTAAQASVLAESYMKAEKRGVFIQSWFSHREMSRYMWDSYGEFNRNEDCVLMTVQLQALGEYLDSVLPLGYRMRHVTYVPNKNIQRDGIFTKEMGFEREKEYRISIDVGELIFHNPKILPDLVWPLRPTDAPRPSDLGQNYRNNGIANEEIFQYVNDDGFVLRAPLAELVEAVYVPSAASEEFCATLNTRLNDHGYKIKCTKIDVPPSSEDGAAGNPEVS